MIVLAIAPWTWRNYKVTGLFIPIAGNSGYAYFCGNSRWGITLPATHAAEPPHGGELRHAGLPGNNPKEWLHYYGFRDPKVEKLVNDRFKQHLKAHPREFVKKLFLNAIEYYWPLVYYLFPPPETYAAEAPFLEAIRHEANPDSVPLTTFNLVFVAVSFCGLVYLLKRKEMRAHALLLMCAWAVYALPYFVFLTFVSHGIYTFGTIPVLSYLTAVFLLKPKTLPTVWGREQGMKVADQCWVCGKSSWKVFKHSTLGDKISSEDFRITDARYGHTARIDECLNCGFRQCNDLSSVIGFYENLGGSRI